MVVGDIFDAKSREPIAGQELTRLLRRKPAADAAAGRSVRTVPPSSTASRSEVVRGFWTTR